MVLFMDKKIPVYVKSKKQNSPVREICYKVENPNELRRKAILESQRKAAERELLDKKCKEKEANLEIRKKEAEKRGRQRDWELLVSLVKLYADSGNRKPLNRKLNCPAKAFNIDLVQNELAKLRKLNELDGGFYHSANAIINELVLFKYEFEKRKKEKKPAKNNPQLKVQCSTKKYRPVKIGFEVESEYKAKRVRREEVVIDKTTKRDGRHEKSILYAAGWNADGAFEMD